MKNPNRLKKGDLVRVGDIIGVVTHLEPRPTQVSVWYGELAMNGSPRVRTVPLRSVQIIPDLDVYVSSQ